MRFDVADFTIFGCNLSMLGCEYPRLDGWLGRLYWDESDRTDRGAFKKTMYFDAVCSGTFVRIELIDVTDQNGIC